MSEFLQILELMGSNCVPSVGMSFNATNTNILEIPRVEGSCRYKYLQILMKALAIGR